jgi:predicted phosphodiesterase
LRLHVLSDLHLERAPLNHPNGTAAEADVLVLAGDIDRGTSGIAWARERAAGRPVLYVAGNHEFYGHALPALLDELRTAAAGSPVHLLEDGELVLGGVRFLGCTLWSDFEFAGSDQRERSMLLCERLVRDYAHIRSDGAGQLLTAGDTLARHRQSRRWLAERLADPFPGATVVVTHHAPAIRGRPEGSVLRAVAGAFASDVTDLMGADRVALWIYGHTHRAADFDIAGTRVFSNPRGYPRQPVTEFDPDCVITV